MSTTTQPTTATQLRVATPVQYDGVERLAIAFEKSAKRWEMVAYPAMVLFTLLAVFGFYKIYSVSENMRIMAERLQPQMGEHMDKLTNSMESLTANIAQMSRNIDKMQQRIVNMSNQFQIRIIGMARWLVPVKPFFVLAGVLTSLRQKKHIVIISLQIPGFLFLICPLHCMRLQGWQ